jgi:integrase
MGTCINDSELKTKLQPLQVVDINPPHRGMTPYECKMICTSPEIPLQKRLYFRLIYESLFRPFEVLHLKIEDWDRKQFLVTARKVKQKYDRRNQVYLPARSRTARITENTNQIIKAVVGNRKKGPIFITKTGQPFNDKRHMNTEIDKYARLLGIQQDIGETRAGRKIHLVTLMALRKAGERHHDNNGGSRKLSALAAGHTMRTKERHYDETDFEPVWESMGKNHPAFVEGW